MIRRNWLQLLSLVKTTVNLWLQFLSLSVCAWVMFSSVLAKRFQNLARSFLQPKFFLFSFILLRYHCKFSSWLPDSKILLELIVLETLPSLLLGYEINTLSTVWKKAGDQSSMHPGPIFSCLSSTICSSSLCIWPSQNLTKIPEKEVREGKFIFSTVIPYTLNSVHMNHFRKVFRMLVYSQNLTSGSMY